MVKFQQIHLPLIYILQFDILDLPLRTQGGGWGRGYSASIYFYCVFTPKKRGHGVAYSLLCLYDQINPAGEATETSFQFPKDCLIRGGGGGNHMRI